MKVPLISLLVAILLVGGATIVSVFLDDDYTSNNFTKKDAKIDTTNSKELQIRNGIIYFPDGVTPYTGRIQQFWDSGELYFEKNYNDGIETSACFWYKNGQKSEEKVYIDGMIKFWKKWHENGQLFYEPIYKNGVKQSMIRRYFKLAYLVSVLIGHGLFAKVIYVDDNATAGGDGASWVNAHKYLQDGLAVAEYGDEIWVAEGTYKPDQGAGKTARGRGSPFVLVNGVGMYRDFLGTESSCDPNTPTYYFVKLTYTIVDDYVGLYKI